MAECAVVIGHRQLRDASRMNAVEFGRLLLVGVDSAGAWDSHAAERIVGTRLR
jgi:hypothetical protein